MILCDCYCHYHYYRPETTWKDFAPLLLKFFGKCGLSIASYETKDLFSLLDNNVGIAIVGGYHTRAKVGYHLKGGIREWGRGLEIG